MLTITGKLGFFAEGFFRHSWAISCSTRKFYWGNFRVVIQLEIQSWVTTFTSQNLYVKKIKTKIKKFKKKKIKAKSVNLKKKSTSKKCKRKDVNEILFTNRLYISKNLYAVHVMLFTPNKSETRVFRFHVKQ